MLKVLFISKIYSNQNTGIRKDIIDLLGADIGDDILFVVDKYGVVKIRKSGVMLAKGEKYIGTSRLARYIKRHKYREQSSSTSIFIADEVRQAINVDIGDDILWILDQDGNIILRNNVILGMCSFDILNKDIGALIICISTMSLDNNMLNMPKEIIDILGIYEEDKVALSLDKYGNVIISKNAKENLLQECSIVGDYSMYLGRTILLVLIEMLHATNKILWIFDEEGNVIIKNDLLPENCIKVGNTPNDTL